MFVELMPVLADRMVMITVARLNDESIRVNVIPQRVGENDNAALATPFSITGSPAELDAELTVHLIGYIDSHRQLRTTLSEAKAQMDAAAKTAQEEAKRKSAGRQQKAAQNQPRQIGTEEKGIDDESSSGPTVQVPEDAKPESAPRLF